MSPEAQRIAIAEVCGWKILSLSCGFFAKHKTEDRISISAASARATRNEAMNDRVPDYLNSLDAMNMVEKSLSWKDEGPSTSERRRYLMNLEAVISGLIDRFGDRPDRTLSVPFATAAQRAEAFLKTVGKWQG